MKFVIRTLIVITVFTSSAIGQEWSTKLLTPREEIKKNKTLEIGINPPEKILQDIREYLNGDPHKRNGLNPFVSWDIDISVNFTHTKTGKVIQGVGFWYTNVERDIINSHWKQLQTSFPFRVRFAPTLKGEWKVTLNSQVKKGKGNVIGELSVNVLDSNHPGHMSVHKNKRYFERDDHVVVPTGVNLPFPYVNNNLLYSQKRDDQLKLNAWVQYRELVEQYITQGGKYFRFFIHPSASDIEFEEVGYYQNRQHFAWEIDHIIRMCEENNVVIDFNLMYHTIMMTLGDYSQYRYDYTDFWHDKKVWPYKDINYTSGYSKLLSSQTPSDMFLEEESVKYLKEKTRYMMARWCYSPAISTIELASEPWHINQNGFKHVTPYDSVSRKGDIARRAMYEYHSGISAYIKDDLSMNYKLVGAVGRLPVGSSNIYSHIPLTASSQFDSTWHDDNIDFISISYYSSSPTKTIISKNSSNNECGESENSMACVIDRLHSTYNKPVMFGEADHGDGTAVCADLQGHQIDVKRYAFTGAAGHYIWATFNYPDPSYDQLQDERTSWSGIINAQEFYNSEFILTVLEKQYIQGRQKSPFQGSREALKEHQYIIDSSRTVAAGYVYNRTFNIHTASGNQISEGSNCYLNNPVYQQPVSITWKPQKLKVHGLRNLNKYVIRYYGYTRGEFLLESEQRSSLFGKLRLKHPILTSFKDGNPLIWYTIQEQ
jgi:hypothetical protein